MNQCLSPPLLRACALVAASVVGLACGTNYVFSAWGGQFGVYLKLTSMEINHLAIAGNLGQHIVGVLAGWLVDKKGPRPAAFLGALAIYHGYMKLAHDCERRTGSMRLHCLLTFLTGAGNSLGSQAAIKTAALNYSRNRGLAIALPQSAYGLSAFFFSSIGLVAFRANTDGFLRLLGYAGGLMVLIAGLFLMSPSEPEPQRTNVSSKSNNQNLEKRQENTQIEIGGRELFRKVEFWQLAFLLCLLTGIGLMTINNLGLNIKWLWHNQKFGAGDGYVHKVQLRHVSILSMASFAGRLSSGICSDYLANHLRRSRVWCLIISATGFVIAQSLAIFISHPDQVVYLSVTHGFSYGFAFGSFPAIVAQYFGVKHFSQNWGIMGLFAIVSGYFFNYVYGTISDSNSLKNYRGQMECVSGVECYNKAYYFTLFASVIALFLAQWTMAREEKLFQHEPERKGERLA